MIRTAILGASGYVGGELLRLIAAHPALEPAKLLADSRAGQPLSRVHPHLGPAFGGMVLERFDEASLDGIDLVLAALPHGLSQKIAPAVVSKAIPFVDLGADFRLADAAEYERWYGHAHQCPELLGRFAYGIPELNRTAIRGSRAVAAAGCHATAAILALKPLVDAGLLERGSLVVDSASGVSGAGREAKEATGFCTVDGGFSAYGLLTHRHTAEIEMALGARVLFTPHLSPMSRGILATCHGRAAGAGDPLEALAEAYRGEPFVHVSPEPPSTKWVAGSNGVHVAARRDDRTGRILALCAIDNLGKGAAGQMIQCANLMLGIDERAGLSNIGVHP